MGYDAYGKEIIWDKTRMFRKILTWIYLRSLSTIHGHVTFDLVNGFNIKFLLVTVF